MVVICDNVEEETMNVIDLNELATYKHRANISDLELVEYSQVDCTDTNPGVAFIRARLNRFLYTLSGHPESKFLRGFAARHREAKDLSEDDMLEQSMDHLLESAVRDAVFKTRELCDGIRKSIDTLAASNDWTSLSNVAKNAIAAEYSVLEELSEPGNMYQDLLASTGFRMNLVNASIHDLPEVITEYFAAQGVEVSFLYIKDKDSEPNAGEPNDLECSEDGAAYAVIDNCNPACTHQTLNFSRVSESGRYEYYTCATCSSTILKAHKGDKK
jgi:hypothetical protein